MAALLPAHSSPRELVNKKLLAEVFPVGTASSSSVNPPGEFYLPVLSSRPWFLALDLRLGSTPRGPVGATPSFLTPVTTLGSGEVTPQAGSVGNTGCRHRPFLVTHQKDKHKRLVWGVALGGHRTPSVSHCYKAGAARAQRRLTPSKRMMRPAQELVVKNCSRSFRSCTRSTTSSSTSPFRLRSALLRHCAFHLLNSALPSMR